MVRMTDFRPSPIMKSVTRLVLCGLVLLTAIGHRSIVRAQNEHSRSTMSGVFTQAQANAGEETYMSVCVACHPAGTYSSAAFKTTWNGRPLSDLFSLIKERMPKNEPGTLSPEETAQLVAYILKINGTPTGKTELPAEVASLKEIRIEIPDH
jgi:cytochrome c553